MKHLVFLRSNGSSSKSSSDVQINNIGEMNSVCFPWSRSILLDVIDAMDIITFLTEVDMYSEFEITSTQTLPQVVAKIYPESYEYIPTLK
jgi:hypothetical protein